ncbi:unnamed protein product [Lampetra fluviatilis]
MTASARPVAGGVAGTQVGERRAARLGCLAPGGPAAAAAAAPTCVVVFSGTRRVARGGENNNKNAAKGRAPMCRGSVTRIQCRRCRGRADRVATCGAEWRGLGEGESAIVVVGGSWLSMRDSWLSVWDP